LFLNSTVPLLDYNLNLVYRFIFFLKSKFSYKFYFQFEIHKVQIRRYGVLKKIEAIRIGIWKVDIRTVKKTIFENSTCLTKKTINLNKITNNT
jgi:hypothetical protein